MKKPIELEDLEKNLQNLRGDTSKLVLISILFHSKSNAINAF